ncbi:MAG: PD-(D/E)XK nuclease family protein [Vulcanisaeta sp. AZ3]
MRINRAIAVTEISQQFYCEYKLHLSLTEGTLETPQMSMGTLIHDLILGSGVEVTREELMDKIKNGDLIIASLPLEFTANNALIIGIPDAVIFRGGRAEAIVELKTTNKWLGTLFIHEYIQAQLYAYALVRNKLGDKPLVVIVKVIRDPSITPRLRASILKVIIKYLDELIALPMKVKGKDYTIHFLPYDNTIETHLKWALDYWLNDREPVANPSPGKCMVCEFKNQCPHARLGED